MRRDAHCSAKQAGTIYASLTGFREDDTRPYVYVSTDTGRTWRSIAANLPQEAVNVIKEDPADPAILYVGTDLGVYVSRDRGARWESLSALLPTVAGLGLTASVVVLVVAAYRVPGSAPTAAATIRLAVIRPRATHARMRAPQGALTRADVCCCAAMRRSPWCWTAEAIWRVRSGSDPR